MIDAWKAAPKGLSIAAPLHARKCDSASGSSGGSTRTKVQRASALAARECCTKANPWLSTAASTAALGKENTRSRRNFAASTPVAANQSRQEGSAPYSVPQSTHSKG